MLDDNSDDGTVEVVRGLAAECNVVEVISKDGQAWFRNETGDRNLLLQAGRAHGGTHFIVLDADEAFTGNLVDSGELRSQIFELRVGQSLGFHWIQLWKSIHYYRTDRLYDGQGRQHGILASHSMACIFCDDGVAQYEGDFIHTRRIPESLSFNSFMIKDIEVGLMHFQYVNWPNFILKQSWYKCFERVRLPDKPVGEINVLYSGSLDVIGERATAVNPAWFARYEEWMDVEWEHAVSFALDRWRLPMIDSWIESLGAGYFAGVGVWKMLQSVELLEGALQPTSVAQVRGILQADDADEISQGRAGESGDLGRMMSFIIPPLPDHERSAAAVAISLTTSLRGQQIDAESWAGQGPSWEVVVCVCDAESASALTFLLQGLPGRVVTEVSDCTNTGAALNGALRRVQGSVVAVVSGCVRLQPSWLQASLAWFCEGGSCKVSRKQATSSGSAAGTRIRRALLSYPEEAILSPDVCHAPSDPSGVDEAWQRYARGESGDDTGAILSPIYPRDALEEGQGWAGPDDEGFKAHWRWGGVVVASARSVLQRANGFPQDASVSLHLQLEHFKDRAAIFKVSSRWPSALATAVSGCRRPLWAWLLRRVDRHAV